MYFIVDSGSTKSDWVLIDKQNNQKFYSTIGYNPYFHDEDFIIHSIRENVEIIAISNQIEAVYFYGAGCSSEDLNAIVIKAFQEIFKNAKVMVDHDLKACAYATYQGNPAISCIIGTGSNSCYFDGENISEELPALGYILGDEGSGSYFGKKLLAAYLYKQLPKHIEKDFVDTYKIFKDDIVKNVYMKPNVNVYLARFSKFVSKHAKEPYFKEMVYLGMKDFVTTHVCCYPNYKNVKAHFIGSIAHVFSNELEKVCKELEVDLGNIIQKPINGLVNYHLNHKVLINH